MFDTLTDRFEGILTRLRGRGRLGDAEVAEVLREIRVALLEADVNLAVVRDLIERIRASLHRRRARQDLTPAQQVIKVVNEELTATLGGEAAQDLATRRSRRPSCCSPACRAPARPRRPPSSPGGSGQQGRNPYLSGPTCSAPRPSSSSGCSAREVGVAGVLRADRPGRRWPGTGSTRPIRLGRDVVIVDTAGRLAIDEELMDEVRRVSGAVKPDYTFFVVDAMTGQDAVQTAEAFHERARARRHHLDEGRRRRPGRRRPLGQAGGRQADRLLSHRRAARRLRGLPPRPARQPHPRDGRRAQPHREGRARVRRGGRRARRSSGSKPGTFTLEDFLDQLRQMKKMGPLSGVLGDAPGRAEGDARRQDRRRATSAASRRSSAR